MIKQSDPHCEFCEGPATWIAVPQAPQPQYGCRLSCDRHRHWVRRLITMDVGSGVYVREYHGCDLCEGPVTADRLPPAYAVPVCHRCLPPPEPLPVADQYDERHSPGGESQVERLSDVDRQLCAIRARLECARQGYAVHVGCGGECTEDSPGGYAYTCQACGATVDWRSPDIAVPPAHDHYERDVAWLLSRLDEQRGAPYTEADELVVTWYSQGPDGELDLHSSADDARGAAESMLEYYSDNAASDGEWNTDIGNLQWGRLVPHEVANIHEIPAPEGFPDGEYWDVALVPYQPKKG